MRKGAEGSGVDLIDWFSLVTLCAAYVVVFWVAGSTRPESQFVAFSLGALLIWLSLSDLQQNVIPDLASLSVALIGLFAWWDDRLMLAVNVLVALIVTLCLASASQHIWRRTGRDVLGLGDVKLIGAGGLVVGAEAFWVMLLIASVGGVGIGLFDRELARKGIPFGPFLSYSIFITFMLFGPYP